ncbi:DEXX-box atpase protein [Halorhabdus tiamatea SARL4B]|uniref:Archaeal ATPase n=1 Tax=Halorhabdus tiamatea SARL4B TaxID=1033806 RepID=F7PNL1_9EURY|nr:ATP-binding protein [Halorhabdus tiamatea]ERJ05294.1 DEXX-box atpase protein [Halorhabdus tiamatea SARL4B]CCQ33753.1 archaeal ATPase [Halorhabdus tiamatea SARL4B]
MTEGFVDRADELDFLRDAVRSDGFELILLYGRRRVGKTELAKAVLEEHDGIYHVVVEEEGSKQRESLVASISQSVSSYTPAVADWEDVFEWFVSVADGEVLVIDEFPRLIAEDDSIPSRFQKFVDEYLQTTDITLILTGSSIGMMEDLMAYENPLYGRRTGQIDLRAFSFRDAVPLLPGEFEDQIQFFSVFGGIPFYLDQIDPEKALMENVRDRICDRNAVLNQEPRMLVKQEFRSPARYLSILESVASGKTRPKRIADDTDIPLQSISKYLAKLESIRLLEHTKPVTSRNTRSRDGIYTLGDHFFEFWYRFIYPNMSDVVRDPDAFVESLDLRQFVGRQFEDICREVIDAEANYPKIGSWWYEEDEIDVVALDEDRDRILFGEAKWRSTEVGSSELERLRAKSERVRWRSDQREERFALFSKRGFTDNLREEAADGDVALYDLDRIERVFTASR